MEAYHAFAAVYDRLMDEIPYKKWCDYVSGILENQGISDGLLLELGCGTGTLTEMFAKKGYDMIGVDLSEDMLAEAMEKRSESGLSILYLQQDMREFELYGTVAAVISLCDTMNYLTEFEDLVTVLRLVNNYLDPQGIFVFDLKTDYYFANEVGEQIFAEADEEVSYIWQNEYDEDERINQYLLTLFLQEEDGRYSRYDELHEQRAYTLKEIKKAARLAGMEFAAAYDEHGENATERANRMYIVLKEHGKKV